VASPQRPAAAFPGVIVSMPRRRVKSWKHRGRRWLRLDTSRAGRKPATERAMLFKTVEIEGLKIFYREAGKPGLPKLVLLHGFPASSHQYRNLMTALSEQFHLVSPDYPGFGNSDMPDPKKFSYTFDKTAEIVEKFLLQVGFTKFGLYVQDYGGPVGFRILNKHPDWLEWLIIQNTNAFEVGFTAAWEGLRGAYWKDRSPENEKAVAAFLEPDPTKISPDNWNMDNHFLERPNAKQVQLDFFYDYRTNVALYPKWQTFLKEKQPKTIIFWGQTDIFFTKEGGEAFLEVLPNAEMHRLDSGHFAVEDSLDIIASKMSAFYRATK
jgi:pimeloyl-ACP methyl ester carboxylesterase